MVQQILVLSAKGYNFEKDSKKHEGTTVYYLMTDAPAAKGLKGFVPVKGSLNVDQSNGIQAVPGIYEGAFTVEMVPNANGQIIPAFKLNSISFIAPVDLGGPKQK